MRKKALTTVLLFSIVSFLSGCSNTGTASSEPSVIDSPEKITFLESSLEFECTDKNEYFYTMYFGINLKNDTGQTITNENLDSMNLEAGLLNINGLGRVDTKDFAVPSNGIESGKSGLLAFSLIPSLGFEWKSFDISRNGNKLYEEPVRVSESLCS